LVQENYSIRLLADAMESVYICSNNPEHKFKQNSDDGFCPDPGCYGIGYLVRTRYQSDTFSLKKIDPPEGLDFQGTAQIEGLFEGNIHVGGKFEGFIATKGMITIEENSSIKGDIYAGHLIVKGELFGNISAIESVEIGTNGSIYGDIKLRKEGLIIQDGGVFKGRCEIGEDIIAPESHSNQSNHKNVRAIDSNNLIKDLVNHLKILRRDLLFPMHLYQVPITNLELDRRIINALNDAGVKIVGNLLDMIVDDDHALLKIRGIKEASVKKIKHSLSSFIGFDVSGLPKGIRAFEFEHVKEIVNNTIQSLLYCIAELKEQNQHLSQDIEQQKEKGRQNEKLSREFDTTLKSEKELIRKLNEQIQMLTQEFDNSKKAILQEQEGNRELDKHNHELEKHNDRLSDHLKKLKTLLLPVTEGFFSSRVIPNEVRIILKDIPD
jgi:cytoskeletal protein CcmA (bactofilin family)